MENELEIDIEGMDIDQLKEYLGTDIEEYVPPEIEVSTDTTEQPEQVQPPSTEGSQNQGYIPIGEEGFVPRPGVTGAVQDIAQSTVVGLPKNLYEGAAPAIGVIDTAIDTFNLLTGFKVPKLPEYEDNMATAVRNISGLVLPSLGLRSMALQGCAKLQAAGIGP